MYQLYVQQQKLVISTCFGTGSADFTPWWWFCGEQVDIRACSHTMCDVTSILRMNQYLLHIWISRLAKITHNNTITVLNQCNAFG